MSVLGRVIPAWQKKSGKYSPFSFNGQHAQVLCYLATHAPASDYNVVKAHDLGSHQLGARRCELRDAGLVKQIGTSPSGMTWGLTRSGRDLLIELETGRRPRRLVRKPYKQTGEGSAV